MAKNSRKRALPAGLATDESGASQKSKKKGRIKTNKNGNGGAVSEDWLADLARSSVASSSPAPLVSASLRIKRREEKQKRRNDRQLAKAKEREIKVKKLAATKEKRGGGFPGDRSSKSSEKLRRRRGERREKSGSNLSILSAVLEEAVAGHAGRSKRPRPYSDPASDCVRGKAVRKAKTDTLEENNIQPKAQNYGGLGLGRTSMYLDLLDPSFIPKFEQEFSEHVKGFFGKQRTKAMKKQLDGGMLWRRLADKKAGGGSHKDGGRNSNSVDWEEKKLNGVRLADMTPDNRVEAMIKLGML